MVIAARIGIVPIVVAGLVWMAAEYALMLQAPRVPEPGEVETGARVRSVTLVTKSPARRSRSRLPAGSGRNPPPDWRCRTRSCSSRSRCQVGRTRCSRWTPWTRGARPPWRWVRCFRVRYPKDDARGALLTEGTRTFVVRNRYHYLPAVVVVPLIGMLGAWGFRSRRKRRSGAIQHWQSCPSGRELTAGHLRLHPQCRHLAAGGPPGDRSPPAGADSANGGARSATPGPLVSGVTTLPVMRDCP